MEWFTSLKLARGANAYSLYVLALLLFAYLLNQLDRYTLAIVTKPAAQVRKLEKFRYGNGNHHSCIPFSMQ